MTIQCRNCLKTSLRPFVQFARLSRLFGLKTSGCQLAPCPQQAASQQVKSRPLTCFGLFGTSYRLQLSSFCAKIETGSLGTHLQLRRRCACRNSWAAAFSCKQAESWVGHSQARIINPRDTKRPRPWHVSGIVACMEVQFRQKLHHQLR